MRRATRFLLHLYPTNWRRRYASEFDALLAEAPSNWRGFFNVLAGAIRMQLTTWTFARIVAAFAIAGLLIAYAGAFLVPNRYYSNAFVKMSGANASSVVYSAQLALLSDASLSQAIIRLNLYREERKQVPLHEVCERMRHHISISAIPGVDGTFAPAFRMQFEDSNRMTAWQVNKYLLDRLSFLTRIRNLDTTLWGGAEIPPPALSRLAISNIGLFAGACFGLLIATFLWLRRRYVFTVSRRIADAPADRR